MFQSKIKERNLEVKSRSTEKIKFGMEGCQESLSPSHHPEQDQPQRKLACVLNLCPDK